MIKSIIVKMLAKILPDYCPAELLFGVRLCQLNPWYEEVIQQKIKNKGYVKY